MNEARIFFFISIAREIDSVRDASYTHKFLGTAMPDLCAMFDYDLDTRSSIMCNSGSSSGLGLQQNQSTEGDEFWRNASVYLLPQRGTCL